MGRDVMIEGLEEGLIGMKAGGTRRLIIPSTIGYRDRGHEPVPREFGQRQRLFGTVLNDNRKLQEASGLGDGNDVAGIVLLDIALLNVRPPLTVEPAASTPTSVQRLRGGACRHSGATVHVVCRRAAAFGLCGAVFTAGGTAAQLGVSAVKNAIAVGGAVRVASAYDAIPTTTAPDAAEVASRRRAREAKASRANLEVAPLLASVRAASTAVEYDAAMTRLTLWIIGSGPPIVSDPAWGSTFDGPLPDGFKTRDLVATCKEALDQLPRFRQKAGEYVSGLGQCEATRESSFCVSAGPLAESAYKQMLVELKKRAPRQYDTPYGPVAF